MHLVVTAPCITSASRLASMRHPAIAIAPSLRWPSQSYLRTPAAVACDDYEFSDEYADALARYTALGIFDNRSLIVEVDDDDDTTTEEMVVRADPNHTLPACHVGLSLPCTTSVDVAVAPSIARTNVSRH